MTIIITLIIITTMIIIIIKIIIITTMIIIIIITIIIMTTIIQVIMSLLDKTSIDFYNKDQHFTHTHTHTHARTKVSLLKDELSGEQLMNLPDKFIFSHQIKLLFKKAFNTNRSAVVATNYWLVSFTIIHHLRG